MKTIQHANEDLLKLLFDWKSKEGHIIRFSIEKDQSGKWVLSFFSVNYNEENRHVFASFSGKSHDELNKWALDRLVNYKLTQIS